MKQRTKGWLIAAVSLILIGSIMFVGVMSKMNWDLSVGRYETNTYTVQDAFTHLSVTAKTTDVTFAVAEEDTVSVVCYEDVNVKHTVSVEGDTLVIREVDTRKWYQHLSLLSDSPKITVYLPAGIYGALTVKVTTGDVTIPEALSFTSVDLKVTTGDIICSADVEGDMTLKATTGDIKVSSVTCGHLTVDNTTGDIGLTDVTCRNVTSTGTTGDLVLRNVIAAGTVVIERGTGDVSFAACDAAELTVETTTGDITGTLLTAKVFDAHATTGEVSVPQTTTGGRCKLSATTGDIHIRLV